MRFGSITALVALAAVSTAVSAESPARGAPANVVESYEGPIFVTPEGRSLYYYGGDGNSGKSSCSSTPSTKINDPTSGFGTYNLPGYRLVRSCAEANPPFLAPAGATAGGDWTLLERAEGKQWVFRGRPLYTSTRDAKPGERNGTARDQGGRRGLRLASAPVTMPSGLDFIRIGDEVVLADAERRPLYTPRGGRLQPACVGCEEGFKPLAAPALAKTAGEWSVIGGGLGSPQYGYRGKPLFLQPDGLSLRDIDESAQWERIVVTRAPPLPNAVAIRYNAVLGDIYTARNGRTLYIYTCTSPGCDQPGGPAGYLTALCGDAAECSRRWRPYPAAPGAKPSGEWSIVEVADPLFTDPNGALYPPESPRVKAWAYQGRPVFTFHEDRDPGDIWGHMLRWFSFSGFVALQVPGREVVY